MSIPTLMPVQVTSQTTEVHQMGYASPQGQQYQPMYGQYPQQQQQQQQYVNGQPQQYVQMQPQQQYMNGQSQQGQQQQYVVNGQMMQQPQQQQQYVNGQMQPQQQPPQYQIPYGQQPQQMLPYQQQPMQPYQQQQPIPQQQVQVVSPIQQFSTGVSQAASSLFGMMSTVTITQPQPVAVSAHPITTNSTCPKCTGHGWVHDSTMNHDKDKHSKCFFCSDCKTCSGKGVITTTTTTSCHPHGHSHSHGPQTCPKCTGHGWTHDSSMKHDKDKNSKCFFCSDCKTCSGKGIL